MTLYEYLQEIKKRASDHSQYHWHSKRIIELIEALNFSIAFLKRTRELVCVDRCIHGGIHHPWCDELGNAQDQISKIMGCE